METRVLKVLTEEDIKKIQDTVSSWRIGEGYKDVEGYCKSSTTEEIEKNNYVLTPGRYVGFVNEEDDGIPFEDKFKSFQSELNELEEEGSRLFKQIKKDFQKITNE